MAERSPKPCLPHGWTVHVSKKYPDKVYYFNTFTGDATWECPALDSPRILPENKDKFVADSMKKGEDECPPEPKDNTPKSPVPPTAVVVPLGHKNKDLDSPSPEKRVRFKRKRDCLEDVPHDKSVRSDEKLSSTTKKYTSPLDKADSQEVALNDIPDEMQIAPVEMSEDPPGTTSELSTDCSIRDVEMRDVSADILEDLNEKKENVFDPSACYYIVIDTNVLIKELDLINELKDTPLDGCGPPHIFIPWVVIEELDNLKRRKDTQAAPAACEAIRYLNSVLSTHPRFHGQSPAEATAWAKNYSKNNDDKVLECCLGLSERMAPEKVVLLTNDKNLVNKALITKINVHSFDSMIKKIKPDTKFNYGGMKGKKRKKRQSVDKATSDGEFSKGSVSTVSSDTKSNSTPESRHLHSKKDSCKREIHDLMSDARLLLKDILYNFFTEEMLKAYGECWVNFRINVTLLKGLLDGILKYWRTVFYEFFTDKDKRNIELLLQKATRPEGFLGDKDECLVILSTIEDIFCQIKKRQPDLQVPIEQIQDYRVSCVNAFVSFSEAESNFRLAEEKNIQELLDDNWSVIYQMCGIITAHYGIPYEFDYSAKDKQYSDFDIHRLMIDVYPSVQTIKKLLCKIVKALEKSEPVNSYTKSLSKVLKEFIPSLNLPYQPKSYPFFNAKCFERWCTNPQNRKQLTVGASQIETFFAKLEEALLVEMKSSVRKSPEQDML